MLLLLAYIVAGVENFLLNIFALLCRPDVSPDIPLPIFPMIVALAFVGEILEDGKPAVFI